MSDKSSLLFAEQSQWLDGRNDFYSERLRKMPNFDELDRAQLDAVFNKLFDTDWESAVISGNYDFNDTKSHFESIFERRNELAAQVRQQIKMYMSTKNDKA